jgi:hypothetical protein
MDVKYLLVLLLSVGGTTSLSQLVMRLNIDRNSTPTNFQMPTEKRQPTSVN